MEELCKNFSRLMSCQFLIYNKKTDVSLSCASVLRSKRTSQVKTANLSCLISNSNTRSDDLSCTILITTTQHENLTGTDTSRLRILTDSYTSHLASL